MLLQNLTIDLVIDVGANIGQFGDKVRRLGYAGRIISFEPLESAFSQLSRHIQTDSEWQAFQCAIGDREGVASINIAGNSQSSSLRGMLPAHVRAAPESQYVGASEIVVHRLDDVPELQVSGKRLYLKSDTQGNEMAVIEGAANTLRKVVLLQIEASLKELYAGETLWPVLHARITDLGFVLSALEPGFVDPQTLELLQVDALYLRRT